MRNEELLLITYGTLAFEVLTTNAISSNVFDFLIDNMELNNFTAQVFRNHISTLGLMQASNRRSLLLQDDLVYNKKDIIARLALIIYIAIKDYNFEIPEKIKLALNRN